MSLSFAKRFPSSDKKWDYVCDLIKNKQELSILVEDALDWSHVNN